MKNGTCWVDTEGNAIQAHGGCILPHEGVYYWYGENKNGTTRNGHVDFIGMSCYSSLDLQNWKNEGVVLSAVSDPNHDLAPQNICERPAVIYCESTGQFVMWFHWDTPDYSYAGVGLALSKSPAGPFAYIGKQRPNGRESRDMNLYVDRDGTAYMLCSADLNATINIHRLDPSYTAVTRDFRPVLSEQYREAPAVLCHEGRYYMVTSACTGWAPNVMLYAAADAMAGTWRLEDNPCEGPDSHSTFFGQSAHLFRAGETWVLLLDHWNPEDLGCSGYSMLPVGFNEQRLIITWRESLCQC